MAKLQEEVIVIKLSKLLRDTDDTNTPILDSDGTVGLEAVVSELVGAGVLVEIAKG